MDTSLRPGDRMYLIDDHPAHSSQYRADGGSEHQIQRFRRCDQDVRRVTLHPASLFLRGVTRAQERVELWERVSTEALGGVTDPGEWRPKIAVYVVSQGLEWRDIEDATALRPFRHGLCEKAVQGPEKSGESLPRACRGVDQGVIPLSNRRPPLLLGPGRGGERSLKPGAGCRGEGLQGGHTRKVSGGGDKKAGSAMR